ncbi:baculoviral IAP repeat-containing protein 3 [Patella vulgata]|uniref:baculoviral IAP repeat-containing protein 3 n=1 Tax=Patella vulgata TaxID=6465 RepID=UPI0024A7D4D1|nr:baculoviral IAP repeat-containing protein 3 [Patella vulgata]
MIRQSLSVETLNQALHRDVQPTSDCMKYEWMRLGSFKSCPRQSEGRPIKLAKAGFVFTGTREGDDTVTCFTCGVTKNNWLKYEDPLQVHKDLNPRCHFINNKSENFPILIPEPIVYDKILRTLHEIYRSKEDIEMGVTGGYSATNDTSSFDSLKLDSGSLTNYGDTSNTTLKKTIKKQGINGYTRSQDPESRSLVTRSASDVLVDNIARQTMTAEEARLRTFGNWPRYLAVRPAELARAGFYYLGSADRVQCAFCRGILRDWEEAESPVAEHWRYFSSCEFLRGTGRSNVPIIPNDSCIHDYVSTHPLSPTDEEDLRGDLNPRSTILNNGNLNLVQRDDPATAKDLGIITQTAAQPDKAILATRVATFANWPRRSPLPSKEQIAEAGFYYFDREDAVKCFFCGGVLKSWTDDDIPWNEHAKWFPKCPYLLRIKGEDFVNSIHHPGAGTTKVRTTVGAEDPYFESKELVNSSQHSLIKLMSRDDNNNENPFQEKSSVDGDERAIVGAFFNEQSRSTRRNEGASVSSKSKSNDNVIDVTAGRPMVPRKRISSNATGENTGDVKDLHKVTCYTAASRLMSMCFNPIKSRLYMSCEKIIEYIDKKD